MFAFLSKVAVSQARDLIWGTEGEFVPPIEIALTIQAPSLMLRMSSIHIHTMSELVTLLAIALCMHTIIVTAHKHALKILYKLREQSKYCY